MELYYIFIGWLFVFLLVIKIIRENKYNIKKGSLFWKGDIFYHIGDVRRNFFFGKNEYRVDVYSRLDGSRKFSKFWYSEAELYFKLGYINKDNFLCICRREEIPKLRFKIGDVIHIPSENIEYKIEDITFSFIDPNNIVVYFYSGESCSYNTLISMGYIKKRKDHPLTDIFK